MLQGLSITIEILICSGFATKKVLYYANLFLVFPGIPGVGACTHASPTGGDKTSHVYQHALTIINYGWESDGRVED